MKKPLLWMMILMLVSWISQPLAAQKAGVRASIDSTRMLIGDQVNLVFELEVGANEQVEFPIFKDTLVKNLEVLSVSPVDSQPTGAGIKKLIQRVLVTSFDTGFYIIPSFYFFNTTKQESLRSEALPLEVLTLEVDTAQGIADIKPPYEVPLTFWDILPYILVALLLAGIGLGIWYILKRKKEKVLPEARPKPAEPAHVWALRELDKLAAQKIWQQGKVKLFHSRVSEILRGYIEFRYEIPALEQTTTEIIDSFLAIQFSDKDLLANLHQSMEISDLVKFAKWEPLPEENEKAIEMAYEFVYKTKKVINLREAGSDESPKPSEKGGEA